MKTVLKLFTLATLSFAFASTAEAGKFNPNPDNCFIDVSVVKVQPQTPRAPVTWNITYSYKTPNMSSMIQGGTYTGILEPDVNLLFIRAGNRLCYAANDPHRFYDICPEVDGLVHGDLDGFLNQTCVTYPGNI
jgi:hypothetical protein